jgi:hypothetical protein
MPRVNQEIRTRVLSEHKTKKTSVAELAKSHGISRSAVYRILDTEKKSKAPAVSEGEEEQSDGDEQKGQSFFYRNEKFAEDLGLQEVKLRNDDDRAPARSDEEIDDVIDGFMSNMDRKGQHPSGPQAIFIPPPPPPAPAQDPEPRLNREDLIQRIVFNVQHFGSLLTTITGPPKEFIESLTTKDSFTLKHLLTTLERTRSVGTISAGFKQVFYIASQGVEVASRLVGVKSQGFTSQLQQQDEEITMCMKEIAMAEYDRLKRLDSPQARLGILFCLTLAQTHTRNEMLEAQPISPQVVEATNDL